MWFHQAEGWFLGHYGTFRKKKKTNPIIGPSGHTGHFLGWFGEIICLKWSLEISACLNRKFQTLQIFQSNCFSLSHIPLNSMLEINSKGTILITQRHTNILGFSESCISIMPSSPLHVKILTWLEVPSPYARSRCSIRQVMLCHLVPGGTETWHQIDAIWNNMMLYEMNIDILQMRKWYLYFIGFYWYLFIYWFIYVFVVCINIYTIANQKETVVLWAAPCLPSIALLMFRWKTWNLCHNEHTNSI